MSPFRRKRDGKDESSQDTVEAEEAPVEVATADEPDPAAWALPADAGAVTTDAGTAATDAAATEPEAAAAVAETVPEVDPTPAPETAASGWTPPASSGPGTPAALEQFNEVTEQRPELLVAGAFAGAFLFARILKRITEG